MNVGFVWRSQVVLPFNGALLANGTKVDEASTHLALPESYQVGYLHSETSIPDGHFNPAVPDADSPTLSVGGGSTVWPTSDLRHACHIQ
jgi:hypothetical protein